MKLGKRILAAIPVAVLIVGVAACGGHNSGNSSESKQQAQDTTNLENSQPLPAVWYSQERQNLIDIELAEINDVRTTTFVTSFGHLIWAGPTIGFGIPDSASLSNPLAPYTGDVNTGPDRPVVGQMDPNGIYAPASSAGTWVIALTVDGTPYIDRFEDNADTVGGPAEWSAARYEAGEDPIVSTGSPTAVAQAGNGRDARNTHQANGLALGK